MNNIEDAYLPNNHLNRCLFFSTAKLARGLGKQAEEEFGKTGLSPSHAILLHIVNQNGSVKQKEVGEMLHLTPSTITRLIDKLDRNKYVKKQPVGKNVYLQTTAEGLALQDEITASWNRLHARYQNILTEEETTLFLEMSARIVEKLENRAD